MLTESKVVNLFFKLRKWLVDTKINNLGLVLDEVDEQLNGKSLVKSCERQLKLGTEVGLTHPGFT